jgi:hypothetical protein
MFKLNLVSSVSNKSRFVSLILAYVGHTKNRAYENKMLVQSLGKRLLGRPRHRMKDTIKWMLRRVLECGLDLSG